MTIQHRLISDPDLHEPKGIASSAANKVYVADGEGSGSWEFPPASVFGEIYIDIGVTTQTLSAASAYAKLNPTAEWTQGIVSGLTSDPTNGYLTLTQAGKYEVTFWIVLDTAAISATSTYKFKYAINDVINGRTLSIKKYTNGAERLTLSATGYLSLDTAGSTLSIQVAGDDTSSSTNITVIDAGLSAIRLSE
jgi:hypothetical protein